jgi:hypothetical protein
MESPRLYDRARGLPSRGSVLVNHCRRQREFSSFTLIIRPEFAVPNGLACAYPACPVHEQDHSPWRDRLLYLVHFPVCQLVQTRRYGVQFNGSIAGGIVRRR